MSDQENYDRAKMDDFDRIISIISELKLQKERDRGQIVNLLRRIQELEEDA